MLVSSTVILALGALTVTALPTTNNKRWARPTVDLGYASYQGIYNETTNIQSFKGIRYAAPPLGDLRWKAPQPPTSLTGLQDASEYGQTCIQGTVGGSADQPVAGLLAAATASFATSSEDCLFINVFTPPNTTVGQASLLPVGVYIHGGGYTLGSGNDYDRESAIVVSGYHIPAGILLTCVDPVATPLFAQSEGNYVWVTMNYRLNTFGFLAGNEVAAGGALNAGLCKSMYYESNSAQCADHTVFCSSGSTSRPPMGPNKHCESTLPCFPVPTLPADRAPITLSSAETRPTSPSGVNPPAPVLYTSKYVPISVPRSLSPTLTLIVIPPARSSQMEETPNLLSSRARSSHHRSSLRTIYTTPAGRRYVISLHSCSPYRD
jgi:hypothetical protein